MAILSKWQLNDPMGSLAIGVLHWLMFTMKGAPDLNGVIPTSIIMAGATWTLPYEGFFYLILPLLVGLIGLRLSVRYFVMGVVVFSFLDG